MPPFDAKGEREVQLRTIDVLVEFLDRLKRNLGKLDREDLWGGNSDEGDR